MPNFPRTDLAVEAEAIHRSAAAVTELPGVRAEETNRRGFSVTEVHVLDAAGENALCKPTGDYYTLALDPLLRREDDAFENAAQTLAELLRGVLPLMPDASVLVVGLGNRAITPDAVGPDAIDSVMVTRHLREQLPEHFGQFRPVAALAAGVLGTTGVESADMIRALAASKPRISRWRSTRWASIEISSGTTCPRSWMTASARADRQKAMVARGLAPYSMSRARLDGRCWAGSRVTATSRLAYATSARSRWTERTISCTRRTSSRDTTGAG